VSAIPDCCGINNFQYIPSYLQLLQLVFHVQVHQTQRCLEIIGSDSMPITSVLAIANASVHLSETTKAPQRNV
jgi:hypothetical protein